MGFCRGGRFGRGVLSSVAFALVFMVAQCGVKANFDIDLNQMIVDLGKYGSDDFDAIVECLRNKFVSSHEDILRLDKSFGKADKRIRYLYYKVMDKLLEGVPIFKEAVTTLNEIMGHKLTFKTRRDRCGISYTFSEHSFGASLGQCGYDPWREINFFEDFKGISLDHNWHMPKFNRGDFFFPLDKPDEFWPSDKSSAVDRYVSNRILAMSSLDDKTKEMAGLVNSVIHESGHLLHEFLMRGRRSFYGLYMEEWINKVGLEGLVNYKLAGWEWTRLDNKFVDIDGSKLTNFVNFLMFLHVARENGLSVGKEGSFEVSDICQDVYNYHDILNRKLSKNDELRYGHLSGRAMDSSCEFIAELWVATIGCGVRENSWGKVFRNYLKMMFTGGCLGDAGKSWYNG